MVFLFNGDHRLAKQLDRMRLHLSVVSKIELYSWRDIEGEQLTKLDAFMSRCSIVELDSDIQAAAIRLRRAMRLTVADAIVAATAQVLGQPLFTGDQALRKLAHEVMLIMYEP